jgi:predicted dehydrogenase
VATPHPLHFENTLLCLQNGKHVLCEKPFSIKAAHSVYLVAEARARNLFLMEAMWTRFLPALQAVKGWVDDGRIGDVRHVDASFRFSAPEAPEARLFNPELGGGALLDVGIYPISLACWLLGRPTAITADATIGATGVDYASSYRLAFENGAVCDLAAALVSPHKPDALITGSAGTIRIHGDWWAGEEITVSDANGEEIVLFPVVGNGYNYEADEVARCIKGGRLESSVMSLDESVMLMQTMDVIRGQIDLVYPHDSFELPNAMEACQ